MYWGLISALFLVWITAGFWIATHVWKSDPDGLYRFRGIRIATIFLGPITPIVAAIALIAYAIAMILLTIAVTMFMQVSGPKHDSPEKS